MGTKTYGVGPAAESTNLGEDYSHDGKSSVMQIDGTVIGPDGDVVFDPSKDAIEVKTKSADDKNARVVVEKDNTDYQPDGAGSVVPKIAAVDAEKEAEAKKEAAAPAAKKPAASKAAAASDDDK